MPTGNGSSGPNTIVVLIIGLAVGAAIGYGVANMGDGEDPASSRGAWHQMPSPPGSPDRIVQMNLDEIKAWNDASTAAENPMKAQIAAKLTTIMEPSFEPRDPHAGSLHVHNAWMFAEQAAGAPDPAAKGMLWSTVHEELDEIN